MTIKNFGPIRMSTEAVSSLEAGEYILTRLYLWSDHTIRFRLLGQDFCVKPGKISIQSVLSRDHNGAERFRLNYAKTVKAVVAKKTEIVGNVEINAQNSVQSIKLEHGFLKVICMTEES